MGAIGEGRNKHAPIWAHMGQYERAGRHMGILTRGEGKEEGSAMGNDWSHGRDNWDLLRELSDGGGGSAGLCVCVCV